MKPILLILCIVTSSLATAQVKDLPFGKVTYEDVKMSSYPDDTTARAVMLNEVGQAHIDDDDNLIFEYYAKIKILKKRGFSLADFSVQLYKRGADEELFESVSASSYNLTGVSMRQTKFDPKSVLTEATTKNIITKKFTLPDIHEGTVIEVLYKTKSPYKFNFHTWEFQSDIPKVRSEYWTIIPGNYIYNITLKGYQQLAVSESDILKDCFRFNGQMAECARTHYVMNKVPAFQEEDYMTAKENFLSAIYFELAEVRQFDGLINKLAIGWKDLDDQLRQSDDFGKQIRRAGSVMDDKIKPLVSQAPDELAKAKVVYDFVKSWYNWNENRGKYTELGVKKAFDTRTGNVADINLSLVGALQSLDLKAFPVLISTRDNGLPIEVHPVVSNFNYVVASVEIAGTNFLLDATRPWLPFGVLPMSCLNGKGRLMAKESSWIEIKPKEKQKTSTSIDISLTPDGLLSGKITRSSIGYDGFYRRGLIASAADTAAYVKKLQETWGEIEIVKHHFENLNDIDKPLIEHVEVKIPSGPGSNAKTVFLSPFLIDKLSANPFKSRERLYPVDYGAPVEEIVLLSLSYPADMEVDELPKNAALALPQGGGRYLFSVTPVNNKLSMTSFLTLTRSVYTSAEYHYLKELYDRMLQIQESQIVLKKKA